MTDHPSRSLIAAIDQGTTSSRAILFDRGGRIVAGHQLEHRQITPRPGWVEHDPDEIVERVRTCIRVALRDAGTDARSIAAIGISDQRETTVVWDRRTGRPVHQAIVWQDTRTADAVARLSAVDDGPGAATGQDRFRARTGLPISTYSSALKLRWILDHLTTTDGPDPRHLAFGTIDSWLIWQLTGGLDGGRHVTDVTNASRTMLMDLSTCQWDEGILEELGIPRSMLPEVTGSSEEVGEAVGDLAGVPIAGNLGDQHAALFGQTCFDVGQAKCTYGTGAFMLTNTGETPIPSRNGLITTVAARVGERTTYALEGSVAVAGSLIQWLRDDLGLIADAAEVEALARSVPDSGEIVIVPAFSGLFAPHWRPDARGVIAGLTRFVTKAHVARAALEATAYQVFELDEAMQADLGSAEKAAEAADGAAPGELRVDGGMTRNGLLMQIQADILARSVAVPPIAETSALGAAYAAGLAVGFWDSLDELRAMDRVERRWEPAMAESDRATGIARWRKGVARSLDWVE